MVDVSRGKLLIQAVQPDAGESGVLLLLIAQFTKLVLTGNEGKHTVVIGFLCRTGLTDRSQELLYPGTLEILPKSVLYSIPVQLLRGKAVQDIEPAVCQAELMPYQLVTQPEGMEEKFGRKAKPKQRMRIFGIEQEGMQLPVVLLILFAVIVAQQGHI